MTVHSGRKKGNDLVAFDPSCAPVGRWCTLPGERRMPCTSWSWPRDAAQTNDASRRSKPHPRRWAFQDSERTRHTSEPRRSGKSDLFSGRAHRGTADHGLGVRLRYLHPGSASQTTLMFAHVKAGVAADDGACDGAHPRRNESHGARRMNRSRVFNKKKNHRARLRNPMMTVSARTSDRH